MPFDTSVHFHGIEYVHLEDFLKVRVSLHYYRQLGTPWSDGVPGVSQKPIPSGGSFTYRWKATEFGTYWYI
jgi:FtsP/CotA-like multicopper oxidase with cupredoxin domain